MAKTPTLETYKIVTVYFTGAAMTKAREELGLTQEELAALCKWTHQNQQQLELPGIQHILTDKKREIFERAEIKIKAGGV